MGKKQEKNILRKRKAMRTKHKVKGTTERPRMVVFRSLSNVFVQLVDDEGNATLASSSSLKKSLLKEVKATGSKVAASKIIGLDIAKEAKSKNIDKVVFDRNGYLYHGRVKALADGAREGGLEF